MSGFECVLAGWMCVVSYIVWGYAKDKRRLSKVLMDCQDILKETKIQESRISWQLDDSYYTASKAAKKAITGIDESTVKLVEERLSELLSSESILDGLAERFRNKEY